jgi:DNA excision repair protein ERCC-8
MERVVWHDKARGRYLRDHPWRSRLGICRNDLALYRSAFIPSYISRLELSTDIEIVSGHQSALSSLAVEDIQSRYILTGGSDCKVCLYDLEDQRRGETGARTALCLSSSSRDEHNGHLYAISAIHWYPTDLESFFTSSFDGKMNVWETETFDIAGSFQLGSKVYDCAIHPQNYHSVIACATERGGIRLCDLNSGSISLPLLTSCSDQAEHRMFSAPTLSIPNA